MSERKTFSVEPYIDSGGVLGGKIDVDARAVDSVMKRTAMRRDIVVVRGYGRERQNAMGSDELVAGKSTTYDEKFKKGSLVKRGDSWVVSVNDQALSDEVDYWMQKNYEKHVNGNGQDLFAKKFVSGMNKEVGQNVRRAFAREKGEILGVSSFESTRVLLPAALGGLVVWYSVNSAASGNSAFDLIGFGKEGFITRFKLAGAAVGYIFLNDTRRLMKHRVHSDVLNKWEHWLPNLQVPSVALGSASLAVNSNRLIKITGQ